MAKKDLKFIQITASAYSGGRLLYGLTIQGEVYIFVNNGWVKLNMEEA